MFFHFSVKTGDLSETGVRVVVLNLIYEHNTGKVNNYHCHDTSIAFNSRSNLYMKNEKLLYY